MRFATQLIAYKVQSISIPQVSDWMIKCVMVCIYYGPEQQDVSTSSSTHDDDVVPLQKILIPM